jgi:hypothetical protein
VLALLLTYPLVLHFDTRVISHWSVDVEHSLWIQYWFERALDSPELALFETNALHYPAIVSLQFADLNLAVNLPFYGLGKLVGRVAAYNAMALLAFVASAALLWRFAYLRCRNPAASWLAGVFYVASSYWLASLLNAWVYLIHVWVFPLLLLSIDRAFRTSRLRDWLLVGVSLGLSFHVTPYYFLYALVLLGLLAPWYARAIAARLEERHGIAGLALAATVAALLILPRAVPMIAEAAETVQIAHHGPLNTALAARPAEFWLPSPESVDARRTADGYLVVFLGYTLCAVILAGLLPGRKRFALAPWLVTGFVCLVLSMGPLLRVGAHEIPLPGYALQTLPGFSMTTNHWRWTLPATFCFAIAASLALADRRRWVVPTVLGVHLAELFLVFPLPFAKPLYDVAPAPIAAQLATLSDVRVVLDLTETPKLNQIGHGKRIVGGWLPRLDVETARATETFMRGFGSQPSVDAGIQYLGAAGVGAVITSRERAVIIGPDASAPGRFQAREIEAR